MDGGRAGRAHAAVVPVGPGAGAGRRPGGGGRRARRRLPVRPPVPPAGRRRRRRAAAGAGAADHDRGGGRRHRARSPSARWWPGPRSARRPSSGPAFDTLARIAPGRIIAGLGGGDDESIAEDTAFGVLPGDPAPAGSGTADVDPGAYRLDRLEATVEALAGREYPVWVAGSSPAAVRIAAERADGWNRWGGQPAGFATAAERVRAEVANAGRDPAGFSYTWGGLAVLASTPDEAAGQVGPARRRPARDRPWHAARGRRADRRLCRRRRRLGHPRPDRLGGPANAPLGEAAPPRRRPGCPGRAREVLGRSAAFTLAGWP